MLAGFKQLSSDLTELNRIQSNISKALDPVTNCPLLDGVLLEDIALTTTATNVAHKLGRAPRGWIVVKNNANAVVYQSTSDLPKTFLSLTSSASCTVSLWVF